MEALKQITTALELMQQPAFLVQSGKILFCNSAARPFLLETGASVADLIHIGAEEYRDFTSGQLYLTLNLMGSQVGCYITSSDDLQIWMPESATATAELRALSLTAQILRGPLSAAMNAADQLFPALDPENQTAQDQASQINQRLFQMLRTINNMSDAAYYTAASAGNMEYLQICSHIQEIVEKAQKLTADRNIRIEAELPQQPIYVLADGEKLERALLNLLSNAIKFSTEGSTVHVKLTNHGKRLSLSVQNEGACLPAMDLFTRFLREPSLQDSRYGLGLGMLLVRSTALLHGGTVLVDQPDDHSNRVTMTIALQQPEECPLRCPVMRIDYTGERDHALIELSEVLSAQQYRTEEIH